MADYPLLILGNLSAGPQLLERLNPTLLDLYSRLGQGQTTAASSQWMEGGLSPHYLAANQFTLAGDAVGLFPAGRMIRVWLGAEWTPVAVQGSAYDDEAEVTTVTLAQGVLDAGLTAVALGILTPGDEGALPLDVVRTFGDQAIGGVKSFTERPLLPGDPTQALHPATKGYVDEIVGTVRHTRVISLEGQVMVGDGILSFVPGVAGEVVKFGMRLKVPGGAALVTMRLNNEGAAMATLNAAASGGQETADLSNATVGALSIMSLDVTEIDAGDPYHPLGFIEIAPS